MSSSVLDSELRMDFDAKVRQGCASSLWDPRTRAHRYIALFLICTLNLGGDYCYDLPASLQDQIYRSMLVNDSQFSLLGSVYSWPNVVIVIIGGVLIDRFIGVRRAGILFATVIVIGQAVFAAGAFIKQFWLMVVGRFIYGLGGESLLIAQSKYIVNWFPEDELSFVFGLILSFDCLHGTASINVMVPIYKYIMSTYSSLENYKVLGLTLFCGALICALSAMCAVLMAIMDKRASRVLKKDRNGTEKLSLKDMKTFTASYWFLILIYTLFYSTLSPFVNLALAFFEAKFGLSPASASAANSIVYFVPAIAAPLFGLAMGYTGREIYWSFFGLLLMLLSHTIQGFTFLSPFFSVSLSGLSYSIMISTLSLMVAMIIPEHAIGTAYAVMQACSNVGTALSFMATGSVIDEYGYLMMEVFFCFLMTLSLFSILVVYAIERKNRCNDILKLPSQRKVLIVNDT